MFILRHGTREDKPFLMSALVGGKKHGWSNLSGNSSLC
ncbi:Uncharacterised protein [Streptococcus pneumoniae]|nr:Uncharacterised protein [Streptococcus pneumoniae]CGG51025.1 Uncharacterised protein [Streptococcus pneumoniae]CIR07351.1 Uncharacterised protein [Streptococcus pneumoniae]CIT87085.1 Uncharacterised protein [Streptococcus pneumoniae]CIT97936.1 Uncharacterised protein [Streptococcus pneumoniae]